MCSYNMWAHWNYVNQVNIGEENSEMVPNETVVLPALQYLVTLAGPWPRPSASEEIKMINHMNVFYLFFLNVEGFSANFYFVGLGNIDLPGPAMGCGVSWKASFVFSIKFICG